MSDRPSAHRGTRVVGPFPFFVCDECELWSFEQGDEAGSCWYCSSPGVREIYAIPVKVTAPEEPALK